MNRSINICHFRGSGNTVVNSHNPRTGVSAQGKAEDGAADLKRLYQIAKLEGVSLAVFE